MRIDLSSEFPFDVVDLLCAVVAVGVPLSLWDAMEGLVGGFGAEYGAAVAMLFGAAMPLLVLICALLAVPGTICSIVGLVRIPGRRGLALTGLILNGVVLITFSAFAVLAHPNG